MPGVRRERFVVASEVDLADHQRYAMYELQFLASFFQLITSWQANDRSNRCSWAFF